MLQTLFLGATGLGAILFAAIAGILMLMFGCSRGKARIETPLSRTQEKQMRDREWERALRK
jgi:hypothetical protein